MSDYAKKPPRVDTNRVNNLMKIVTASNDRTHRPYTPRSSNKSKSFNDTKESAPKPLLECLEAAPLLDSKPFEKPQSQRRKKNKPFEQDNLGRIH